MSIDNIDCSELKVVLAYSGGLDTSCAIRWLRETYRYSVVAVYIEIGELKNEDEMRAKALASGAEKFYMLRDRKVFADEYLLPALQANTLYEGVYPLISALSRPLIASELVRIAKQEDAVAVAHGCTGKGNDQARFDISIRALNPALKIIAPSRENPQSRESLIAYAQKHSIPIPVSLDSPYSIDENIWGRSCECGELENPWIEPADACYGITKNINETPNSHLDVMITFKSGTPIAIDGIYDEYHAIISKLNDIAGEHGVGRIDHIENRLIGIKSREVYEAPAAITLIKAHKALEALVLTREISRIKPYIEQQLANVIYDGLWFNPIRNALWAFIKETQINVTGDVKIRLHKGNAIVVGTKSQFSLYNEKLATYTEMDKFDHNAAIGFVKLWGLPTELYNRVGHGEVFDDLV